MQPSLFSSPLDARFEAFHRANPAVFGLFVAFAEQAKVRNMRIGAKAIAERIRWEVPVDTKGDTFKLNNIFVSRYARLVAKERPDLADLFSFRGLKS